MVYLCVNCGIIRGVGFATKVWDQCRCGATDVNPQPCVEGHKGQEGEPGIPDRPKKIYRGFLRLGSNGEEDEILFLTETLTEHPSEGKILAELVQNDIEEHGHYLSVRYFTADERMSIDDLISALVRKVSGEADVTYRMKYSDITGYLYTDEDLQVGGHDLLYELKRETDRFCHLEIEYSKEPRPGDVRDIRDQRIPRVYREAIQTPEGVIGMSRVGFTSDLVKVSHKLQSVKTEIAGTIVKVEGSIIHILEPIGRTVLVDAIYLGLVPWDVDKAVGRRIKIKTEVEFQG